MSRRVLIVDDDDALRGILRDALTDAGFAVLAARDGFEAIKIARTIRPDLILLDVLMPFIDGDDLYRGLRQDRATRYTPIIYVTGQDAPDQKASRLLNGAADYITKPFEITEVVARVASALRTSEELRALNPLSGLPGNVAIARELEQALASGDRACLYCDLDNFKAFNDHYGFARGDDLIVLLGEILEDVAEDVRGDAFVGHIGGDDFVIVLPEGEAEEAARTIVKRFDAQVARVYDAEDRERGYVVQQDRRGVELRLPFVTVSVGIVPIATGRFASAVSVSRAAAEVKEIAKRQVGSAWVLDRRRTAEPSFTTTTS